MIALKKTLVPAAIGGVAVTIVDVGIDVVSMLVPFAALCGLGCCLYMMLGGVLSAYFLKKREGKITLEDGAVTGAIGGVIYAILSTFFGAILLLLGFGVTMAADQYPEEMAGAMAIGGLIGIVIAFVLSLVLGVIFFAVGGALGAKLLEK